MIPHSLEALNEAPSSEFVAALGGVFEHAPWVAAMVASRRPFGSLADLFAALKAAVLEVDEGRRLDLLRGHPELAGAAARSGNMTADSVSEQSGAGLTALSPEREAAFDGLNETYRTKFSFPFIICVRRHGIDSLLSEFWRRAAASPDEERETALAEVFRIAALRLDGLVDGPDRLPVRGRLSTHVLDTVTGRPADGVAVTLVEIGETGERTVTSATTNPDGRTDGPLIGDRPVPRAVYELRFDLAAYHRGRGYGLAEPPFLTTVPLRFGVADPEAHYHVPLLASPWSYSTYRGS
jgi:2-oxo-4-hydroxy-4-carboxy-5-ureidoimidazoline decarboxylase